MNRHWTQVTPSGFPWERDALTFLKERLPEHEPYRVWANFEFLLDGTVGEIDALVVAPKGVFLVEIKSWPGRLDGDAGTWRNTRSADARGRSMDNPLLLTNRKAKRLKSLLGRQKAFRNERVPFITPLVFLSHPELDCHLDADARAGIHGLDQEDLPADVPRQRGGLTGIVRALTHLTGEEHQRLGSRRIDKPMSKRITQALDEAGIRPSQQRRLVGDLELGELLDEGPGYQDFAASHPRFANAPRRVRIYGTADAAGKDERERATRAAQREFELLGPIAHPGIVRALAFHEHELGPAIVFERDREEVRLDHYLEQSGGALSVHDRLAIVRELAESVAYAHGRRLFHRALSPRCVLVKAPGTPTQRCSIINWQTGSRGSGATLTTTIPGTRHVEQLVDDQASAYLAPEALTHPDGDAALLDVFSLGAIAFHVFTDRAPAATLAGLLEVLQRDGALEVSSVLDGAGPNLTQLVREATAADTTQRLDSLEDFLVYLATVEEEVSGPQTDGDGADDDIDLEQVTKGQMMAGFRVERRLGRGSTAIAFLVTDPDEQRRVLKVAADPDRNDRIRDEADVLTKLRDRTIIATFGEPVQIGAHAAVVLAHASEGTLAQHLRRDGRLLLEALDRWGADLLSAVSYLEQVGLPHRDIKPENLGIIEIGPRKQRQLVLMDFSLARAGAEQIHAGTPPYLDPFLGTPERQRWDLAADRFAAAMTLHEMATGALPRWSEDGRDVNPRFASGEVHVDRDTLPRDVAPELGDFFERALRRDARERFDTAEDMLRAWRRIFEALDQLPQTPDDDPAAIERERSSATLDTPITALGLSARATNALEREGATTVADLLRLSAFEFRRLRGVGLSTRDELVAVQRSLRKRLGTPDPAPQPTARTTTEAEPDVQQLDALVAQLLPKRTARNASELDTLRLILGLGDELTSAGDWPSQTEVAQQRAVTRARIGQIVAKARERWRRLPAMTRLREELTAHITALGGVAGSRELDRLIAAERGSADPERVTALATAAIRAAVETESAMGDPRWTVRRTGRRVLLAVAGADAHERQVTADHVARLGTIADELAAAPTLPAPAEVAERLRTIRSPQHLALTRERLVHAAAAASQHVAVSARLELYPVGLAAQRALTLGRAALLGAPELSVDDVQRRIGARFPEAMTLPGRPALDDALSTAGIDLRFDAELGRYVAPVREQLTGLTSYQSSLDRQATASVTHRPTAQQDPQAAEAHAFETRLESSLGDGGMLTLMVAQGRLHDAARELSRFDVTDIDIDELIIRHLHSAADDARVRWDLVLRVDADPSGADWSKLLTLVARAIPAVREELTATSGTALLRNAGLLARYGQLALIDELRDAVMQAGSLRGCWLLVTADNQAELPLIDGQSVPVLTRNEWTRVPESWLENRHRSQRPAAGAA